MNLLRSKTLAAVAWACSLLSAAHGQTAASPSGSTAATPTTPGSVAASPPATVVSWADIENDSYDLRVHFLAGYKQMEAKVDEQIRRLKAKRATMTGTTDTEDWDFAMKEEENARDYLRSIGDELNHATPQTWEDERAKAGRAWVRSQDAYDKVKTSTTI